MRLKGRNFTARINIPTRDALFSGVRKRFREGKGFALATINLDHVTKLEREPAFRAAYAAQDFVVADGNPIVWVARLAGKKTELMPGSELVIPLANIATEEGVKVGLVGSSDQALLGASAALREAVPTVTIAYLHAPEYGFDPEGEDARGILAEIDEQDIQMVFLALGAPKQERFAALGRELAPRAGFASIGAGLDFLSGHQIRAPRWVRKLTLEWLWRLLQNPRRLAARYALCAIEFPGLALRSRSQ